MATQLTMPLGSASATAAFPSTIRSSSLPLPTLMFVSESLLAVVGICHLTGCGLRAGSGITTFDPSIPQTFNGSTGNFWFSPGNFTTAGLGGPTCTSCATNPALRTYGTVPRNAYRGPARTNFDFAIAKTTSIYAERLNAEFRAEFFNIFNHAEFSNPSTNINSSLFGQITSTADPRIIQFAIRLTF